MTTQLHGAITPADQRPAGLAGAPVGLLRRADALAAFDQLGPLDESIAASVTQPSERPAPQA